MPTVADANLVVPIDAGVAVDPIDAAEPSVTLDELLGLSDASPKPGIAGFELSAASTIDYRNVTVRDWGTASIHTFARDGKITHIVAELIAESDTSNYEHDSTAIADVLARMTRAWGKPRGARATRASWRGDRAQWFAITYHGFLRGTPSLVLDVLPPGDDHVCGARDGFAAFFGPFKRALVANDQVALAKLVVDDGSDMITDPPPLSRLPPKPECHLAREVYYWRTVETQHGGTFWRFARTVQGWRAYGPYHIGHDDNPDVTAP